MTIPLDTGGPASFRSSSGGLIAPAAPSSTIARTMFLPWDSQKGYHSNERECLAVMWALRKHKYLLEDAVALCTRAAMPWPGSTRRDTSVENLLDKPCTSWISSSTSSTSRAESTCSQTPYYAPPGTSSFEYRKTSVTLWTLHDTATTRPRCWWATLINEARANDSTPQSEGASSLSIRVPCTTPGQTNRRTCKYRPQPGIECFFTAMTMT